MYMCLSRSHPISRHRALVLLQVDLAIDTQRRTAPILNWDI